MFPNIAGNFGGRTMPPGFGARLRDWAISARSGSLIVVAIAAVLCTSTLASSGAPNTTANDTDESGSPHLQIDVRSLPPAIMAGHVMMFITDKALPRDSQTYVARASIL